ncbi:MAG TPA: non-homologous end-joining DNA ligase [Candidatus Thermoplasmatota archaeon]|nr:non-homologous end-joining DNA ligase [Candidatus Thermoplasmatota archaeon]
MPRTPWQPMLSTPGTMPVRQADYAFEPKWDGMRALLTIAEGKLSILSRNSNEQARRFPEYASLAKAYPKGRLMLDGEIVILDKDGRPIFGELQLRFGLTDQAVIEKRARSSPTTFIAFDVLEANGKDLTGLPYWQRRKHLEELKFGGPNWATTPMVEGDGDVMLAAMRERRFEGVMAKRLDSPYLPGARSEKWLKLRNRPRQEFVVGGWSEGEGSRNGTVGSLFVGYYAERGGGDGKLRFIGRVGSGLRKADLEYLEDQVEKLAANKDPFLSVPKGYEPWHRLNPKLVIEAEFNGLAREGVLRQPSFKGFRHDKDPKEVVWEQAEIEPVPVTAKPRRWG